MHDVHEYAERSPQRSTEKADRPRSGSYGPDNRVDRDKSAGHRVRVGPTSSHSVDRVSLPNVEKKPQRVLSETFEKVHLTYRL